jgi:hypothetical protein
MMETPIGFRTGRFGTVTFSTCSWWDSAGTYYNMNSGTGYYYKVNMVNAFGDTMTPSAISGGQTFSITKN